MSATPLIFQWTVSSYFGWGVYGLNLVRHWPAADRFRLLCACPIRRADIVIDPAEADQLEPVWRESENFQQQLIPAAGREIEASVPVMMGLGNQMLPCALSVHGIQLWGRPTIGVIFSEFTTFEPDALARAEKFRLIVAGSEWNRQILLRAGLERVVTVLQGVDLDQFNPAPGPGRWRGRFTVFSGGKLEYRKGQDLVLAAFSRFAARHPEALLVTAWHSPWPEYSQDFAAAGIAPPPLRDGRIDVVAWASQFGIPAGQIVDLGQIPNRDMPAILRDVDTAIFASRCEAGTNLVAMEAMACGTPTVLSANTGHADLLARKAGFPLTQQGPVAGAHRQGWGESDPEEMTDALEQLFADRVKSRRIGAAGARAMANLDWRQQIGTFAHSVLPVLT